MSENLPTELSDFEIANMDAEKMQEIINVNIGSGGISRFDLDRLKVPSGGSTKWEVPTLEGQKTQKTVAGIVLHWKDVRAYWQDSYSGGGTPPDCYSDDAVVGVGNPGGKCNECPFSEFGSAEEGAGQACKQMRILFILREQDILPLALTAPPTSVQSVKKYFMRLASKGMPFYGCITEFNLEKDVNSNGVEYSVIKPAFGAKLSEEELKQVKGIREEIKPKLEQVDLEQGMAEDGAEAETAPYDITEEE